MQTPSRVDRVRGCLLGLAIGDALGTTEETVKNSLFRATRKLRAQLEGLL